MKLQHALLAICMLLVFTQAILAGSYKWNFAEGEIYTTPVYDSATLYATSYDGNLFAINPVSGSEIWRYYAGNTIDTSPSVAGNTIVIGTKDGHVHAVNTTNGKAAWIFNGTRRVNGILATNSLVYVTTQGMVYAFERTSGVLRWNVSTDNMTTGIGASTSDIYFGSGDYLVALDARNGFERWRVKTGAGWKAAPEFAQNIVYYGTTDQRVHAIDSATGEERWAFKTEGWVEGGVTEQDGTIYFGSDDYSTYALDAKSGTLLWKHKGSDAVTTKPLILLPSAGTASIVVGSNNGVVWGLSASTGDELWRVNMGSRLFSPASGNNLIFMGGKAGLFAISQTGCSIDNPSDGSDVPDSVVFVRGTARAENGVRTVRVSVNGEGFDEASGTNSWAYLFDASNISDRNITIECKVTDNDGNDEDSPFTAVSVTKSKNASLRTMRIGYPIDLLPGGKFVVNATDSQYGDAIDGFEVKYGGNAFNGKDGEAEVTAMGDGFQEFVVSRKGYSDATGTIEVHGSGSSTLIFGIVVVALIVAGGYFLFKKPAAKQ